MRLGVTSTPKGELGEKIRSALSTYLKLPKSEIIVSPNEEKYHEKDDPAQATQPLEEVFGLMRELNEIGLRDRTIGAVEGGESDGFVDALRRALADIRSLNGDEPLQYTELGPEPVKTRFILRELASSGTRIARYSGVDVNPASQATMELAVSEVVPPDDIHYHTVLFEKLSQENFRFPGVRNLVTMLGFEEGNDHPHETHEILEDILKPGDLLLTEMQTLPQTDWAHIFNFYHTTAMRRFSKVTFQRTFPDLRSEYGVFLVPVSLEGFDPLMVAVTAERVTDERALRGKLFVTNYCLKYSLDDYRKVREAAGQFRVISQRTTGDGAIVFQVTQKL